MVVRSSSNNLQPNLFWWFQLCVRADPELWAPRHCAKTRRLARPALQGPPANLSPQDTQNRLPPWEHREKSFSLISIWYLYQAILLKNFHVHLLGLEPFFTYYFDPFCDSYNVVENKIKSRTTKALGFREFRQEGGGCDQLTETCSFNLELDNNSTCSLTRTKPLASKAQTTLSRAASHVSLCWVSSWRHLSWDSNRRHIAFGSAHCL